MPAGLRSGRQSESEPARFGNPFDSFSSGFALDATLAYWDRKISRKPASKSQQSFAVYLKVLKEYYYSTGLRYNSDRDGFSVRPEDSCKLPSSLASSLIESLEFLLNTTEALGEKIKPV